MSSLHSLGGLLLLKHQVTSAPSVVCPLISAASCTTTTTTIAITTSSASGIVPHWAGSRRLKSASSFSSPSLKSFSATRTTTASATSSASGFVPHLAGSRGLKSASSFSSPSLQSLPGTARVGSSSPPGEKAGIMPRKWLSKLGFGSSRTDPYDSPAYGPDDDKAGPGLQFAAFGAGCFWGPELAFQRVKGVSKTEVGYTQGILHNPSYGDVCEGDTGHVEVVRVQYDPMQCKYDNLLDVLWSHHDPCSLNRQGGDVGSQYRSGIYYYTPGQEKVAKASIEAQQAKLSKKIVTEILPAKKFYRAEEYHQQYLAKGGRFGFRQSPEKGCKDPIRCYG